MLTWKSSDSSSTIWKSRRVSFELVPNARNKSWLDSLAISWAAQRRWTHLASPQYDKDALSTVETQIGGLGMSIWNRARNTAIFVAAALTVSIVHIPVARSEIIPLVTIAGG